MKRTLHGLILFLGMVFSTQSFAMSFEVYRADGKQANVLDVLYSLDRVDQVVMGEQHDSAKVQEIEAFVIHALKKINGQNGSNLVAWEFLNWSERERTLPAHREWCGSKLSDQDFLNVLFPGAASSNEPYGKTYLPMLLAACSAKTRLMATNLTRAEKAPAVQGGLSAMNPELVPVGFEMGGENYWQRFFETMRDHAPEAKIKNYFVAQSLVDDVMASKISEATEEKQFVIVGHFHTDYFDGLFARLKKRQPQKTRVLITIVDSSQVAKEDLPGFIRSEKYGPISDFVFWAK